MQNLHLFCHSTTFSLSHFPHSNVFECVTFSSFRAFKWKKNQWSLTDGMNAMLSLELRYSMIMSRRCSIVLSTECTNTNTIQFIECKSCVKWLCCSSIYVFLPLDSGICDDVHCLRRTPECKRIVLQFISPLGCVCAHRIKHVHFSLFLFFNNKKKKKKCIFPTTRQRPRIPFDVNNWGNCASIWIKMD